MKKSLVLASAVMLASMSAYSAEIKWSGDVGTRYRTETLDSGTATDTITYTKATETKTKKFQGRAALAASGGWDNVGWMVGVRTTSSASSYWTDFNNGQDRTFGLDLANMSYGRDLMGFGDFSVTIGRQKHVFAYDRKSENFWDNDVRLDGFGWTWKWGSFGFNAGQYFLDALTKNGGNSVALTQSGTTSYTTRNALGSPTTASNATATNQSGRFSVLYGFQPTFNWRFSDEIELDAAVGYYRWTNTISYTNNRHGFALTNHNEKDNGTMRMDNNSQWQFLANVKLPMTFAFNGELVIANEAKYGIGGNNSESLTTLNTAGTGLATSTIKMDRSAWNIGLTYGEAKKAHDFMLGYNYARKGLAAVHSTFTSGEVPPDLKGHMFKAKYNLADGFALNLKYLTLKELSNKDLNGNAISAQSVKYNYFELASTVDF